MAVDLQELKDDVYNLRVNTAKQSETIERLQVQVADLTAKSTPSSVGAPPISNFVRNGDLSHSFDTYFHGSPVSDDTRFECVFVYTHAAPVAAQQLKEDSVYSGVLVGASTALPDAGRSDTPTMDPYWKRLNGYAMLGSLRSIDFPLPSNIAFPGRTLYIPLICARRSAEVEVPGRLYAGIWDNTSGQRDFISGNGFAITAEVVGFPAATVSREYLIVMTSDSGKTVKSATKTVATAPTDGSFVSGSVYVKLSWPRFAGFIQTDIYRKTGGVYVLLAQESTVTQFFDQGDTRQVVGNYPDTDFTSQRAIASTRIGALLDVAIDGVSPAWAQFTLTIEVPSTYNQSLTTDKQWLRIGLDQACTGTDATHGLLVDLVGLSYVSGSFAHNAEDLKALQQPSSAPSGSSQGGAGTGGSGFLPPSGGTGQEREPTCIMAGSTVYTADEMLRPVGVSASNLYRNPDKYRLLSVDNEQLVLGEIERIREAWVDVIFRIRTESGHTLRCTETHRLITYFGDPVGSAVSRLRKGDPCIVWDTKEVALKETRIVSISRKTLRTKVIQIQMKKNSPQTYLAGEGPSGPILSHNAKILGEL